MSRYIHVQTKQLWLDWLLCLVNCLTIAGGTAWLLMRSNLLAYSPWC